MSIEYIEEEYYPLYIFYYVLYLSNFDQPKQLITVNYP